MTEKSPAGIGDSVGALIEASLKAAGKKLATHCMIGLSVPARLGAISADVTQTGPVFQNKRGQRVSLRDLTYIAGPEASVEDYETDGNTPPEAQVTASFVALRPFVVDGEELVRLGSLTPDPLYQYRCLVCGRTYACHELLARARGNRHACGHCCDKAEKSVREAGGLVTGVIRQKTLSQYQLRHVVGALPPRLTEMEINAIRLTLAAGPSQRYQLPRPIAMFQTGACEALWEPEEGDNMGQQLVARCRHAQQQPIPLGMALEIYGRPPVVMPGLLGIVLLLPLEMCGWREASSSAGRGQGWPVVLPRAVSNVPKPKVEEV